MPLSYRLHAQLAAEHNGAQRWGYRTIHCGSLAAKGRPLQPQDDVNDKNGRNWTKLPKIVNEGSRKKARSATLPIDLDWFVPDDVTDYSPMGDPTTTAQVHPYLFTTSMAELAQEQGVEIILGSVTCIERSNGSVETVTYRVKNSTHEVKINNVTDVVVSAGPWTSRILPEAPISAMRAHSIVIKAEVSNYAIFSEIDLPAGFEGRKSSRSKTVSPEMYARPDGTIYCCGEGDTLIDLPTSSDLVQCDEAKCQDIANYCGSISDAMRDGEIVAKQACYLPSVSNGGGPLIGRTSTRGLFLATGHTCWGIQNSCATGKLISEFVFDGQAKSADIDSLDPRPCL